MKQLKFVSVEGKPNENDMKIIIKGMRFYHANKGHIRKDDVFFSILIKDQKNTVFGSIIVCFLWNGMEIMTLWIDESMRNQGWGRKLMESVEKEGIKRGCTFAYTNTFSWQATEFYRKLGYVLYGKLDDFPKGNSLSYFCKKLA